MNGFQACAITHQVVGPGLLAPGAPALAHLHESAAQQNKKSDPVQNSEHLNQHECINAAATNQPLWFGLPLQGSNALGGFSLDCPQEPAPSRLLGRQRRRPGFLFFHWLHNSDGEG